MHAYCTIRCDNEVGPIRIRSDSRYRNASKPDSPRKHENIFRCGRVDIVRNQSEPKQNQTLRLYYGRVDRNPSHNPSPSIADVGIDSCVVPSDTTWQGRCCLVGKT